jgi:oligoribonuclease NrnB/cAMP/cGMP phosphodiesterase (DHH superfamily)
MIYLFFHQSDLDGHCSGAILRYYHENIFKLVKDKDFKIIPMDYNMSFDDNEIQDGDTVIMSDVTFQPYERLIKLNNRCNLFIYDHHKSVYPTLEENNVKGLYGRDDIAGCELTYANFISAKKVPLWVRLLSDWDCWNNSDKEYWDKLVKTFQMGMRMYDTMPNTDKGMKFWNEWFETDKSIDFSSHPNTLHKIQGIIEQGNLIINYQNQMNEETMQRSFTINWEGLRWIVVNGGKGSPQFDSKWDETKYDAMMSFYYIGSKKCWGISLYTTKDIDLSVIATKYGGGGHPKAAGIRVDNINEILNGSK